MISNLTATEIARACFDASDFNAGNIPNANDFCSKIIRNAPGGPAGSAGQATTFVSGFVNGKYLNMEAYSAELAYRFRTERLGNFAFGVTGYFPVDLTVDNTGVSPDQSVGEIGTSKRQYQFSGAWEKGRVGVNLSANYLSRAQFDVLNTPETRDILSVDSYWLVNGGASYRFGDRSTVRLAVTNLFDKDPPFPAIGIGTYDLLGRRYNLAFEWKY